MPQEAIAAIERIIRPLVEDGTITVERAKRLLERAYDAARVDPDADPVADAIADVGDLLEGWCSPHAAIRGPAIPDRCPVCEEPVRGRLIRAVAPTTGKIHWFCPVCQKLVAMTPMDESEAQALLAKGGAGDANGA